MSELEFELRQLSKVRQPKTLVKVVRQHTRELKRASKRELQKSELEALRELIRAGGGVAQGFATGMITGPIVRIIALAYAGKLGLLDPIYDIASQMAKAIGDGFKTGTVTKFTQDAIDKIIPDLPTVSVGPGSFCFKVTPLIPFALAFQTPLEVCFPDSSKRDAVVAEIKSKLGPLALLYKFEMINK